MTIEAITKKQLANELQLVNERDETSENAVAGLLRTPLSRWRLSPKRAILQYVRDQLRAAGVDDATSVPRVLERLVVLGECDEVYVGNELYLAPAEPRWVPVGEGVGVFLGVSGPPEGVSRAPSGGHRDIVQRIRVASDNDAARLQVDGVREVSMAEWLSPIGYLRHAARRLRRPARSDTITLASFWDLLEENLAEEGLPLSVDAEVRTVRGEPGQFFGRHDAPDPDGRWAATAPNGVWCAVRRGYGEMHWHWAVIAVDGEERRALDLYDSDEWRWALLARGRRLGSDEVVLTSSGSVRLTFPAPAQLRAAMDLLGVSSAPWVWGRKPGAPDVWALVE